MPYFYWNASYLLLPFLVLFCFVWLLELSYLCLHIHTSSHVHAHQFRIFECIVFFITEFLSPTTINIIIIVRSLLFFVLFAHKHEITHSTISDTISGQNNNNKSVYSTIERVICAFKDCCHNNALGITTIFSCESALGMGWHGVGHGSQWERDSARNDIYVSVLGAFFKIHGMDLRTVIISRAVIISRM